MTFKELFNIIIKFYYSKSTNLRTYQSSAKKLLELIKVNKVNQFKQNNLINLYNALDGVYSPASVNFFLCFLKKALDYAKFEGITKEHFIFKFEKIEKTKERILNEAEKEKILKEAKSMPPDLYFFILIGLNTGMRASEILRTQPDAYKMGYIENIKNKTNHKNIIPLNDTLQAELKTFTGFKSNYQSIYYLFNKLMDKLGLYDVTPHTLRHTFCSDLISAGVDLVTVQRLANHKSYNTTLNYIHLQHAQLKKAVNLL